MAKFFDPDSVVKRTVELLGGAEAMTAATDLEFGDMTRRWNQDIDAIGRILRSHLYVEFYITEHLQKSNPNLGSIGKAKLGFAQKLVLLDPNDKRINEVMEGLRHLNIIRNRLAHRLDAIVGPDDSAIFLRTPYFDAMRQARSRPDTPSIDPLDILEEFAQFASHALTHKFSVFGQAFDQAFVDCRGIKET